MCRIQDRLCGCGGLLQLWARSVHIECRHEKNVSRRVQFEAKCRETTRQCYSYHSLLDWCVLAFSLIQRCCSENRTQYASVTWSRGL